MTLTAKRHWATPDLVYVTTDALTPEQGNVVAKANLKHGEVWRTKHAGPKPPLAAIHEAVAQVQA